MRSFTFFTRITSKLKQQWTLAFFSVIFSLGVLNAQQTVFDVVPIIPSTFTADDTFSETQNIIFTATATGNEGATTDYIITDISGTIISVISGQPVSGTVDLGVLPIADYFIYALSYDGVATGLMVGNVLDTATTSDCNAVTGPLGIRVSEGDDDDDGDGVLNSADVCPGFDDMADNDVDGIPDVTM